MRSVRIEPGFASWRAAARGLLQEGVPPEGLAWEEVGDAQGSLFAATAACASLPASKRVPKAFLELARRAACHRSPERWSLLYRVLWRLARGEPHLLELAADPDVVRLREFDKAVRHDVHKMRAFVRFRSVATPAGEWFVAWFEPAHLIVELNAPFFVDRFAQMRWSILTPDRCAHWDGGELRLAPGVPRSEAPADDAVGSPGTELEFAL